MEKKPQVLLIEGIKDPEQCGKEKDISKVFGLFAGVSGVLL